MFLCDVFVFCIYRIEVWYIGMGKYKRIECCVGAINEWEMENPYFPIFKRRAFCNLFRWYLNLCVY